MSEDEKSERSQINIGENDNEGDDRPLETEPQANILPLELAKIPNYENFIYNYHNQLDSSTSNKTGPILMIKEAICSDGAIPNLNKKKPSINNLLK
jgi:hypothetical protein